MGKLILVRHGHTCLNVPGRDERLRGWLDIPLDDQGLQEAADTAERLADHPVEAIYSSDLRRARQTAEVLRRRTGAPRVATSKDLRPWNLGVFCGQRVYDILPFLNHGRAQRRVVLSVLRPLLAAPERIDESGASVFRVRCGCDSRSKCSGDSDNHRTWRPQPRSS